VSPQVDELAAFRRRFLRVWAIAAGVVFLFGFLARGVDGLVRPETIVVALFGGGFLALLLSLRQSGALQSGTTAPASDDPDAERAHSEEQWNDPRVGPLWRAEAPPAGEWTIVVAECSMHLALWQNDLEVHALSEQMLQRTFRFEIPAAWSGRGDEAFRRCWVALKKDFVAQRGAWFDAGDVNYPELSRASFRVAADDESIAVHGVFRCDAAGDLRRATR
jgi:hypothetical protein